MKIEISVIHHLDHTIECKFDQALHALLHPLEKIMALLDALQANVDRNTSAVAAAITLLQNIKALLDQAGTDPVKLKALSDAIGKNDDDLAAAVVANTPTPPPGNPILAQVALDQLATIQAAIPPSGNTADFSGVVATLAAVQGSISGASVNNNAGVARDYALVLAKLTAVSTALAALNGSTDLTSVNTAVSDLQTTVNDTVSN